MEVCRLRVDEISLNSIGDASLFANLETLQSDYIHSRICDDCSQPLLESTSARITSMYPGMYYSISQMFLNGSNY